MPGTILIPALVLGLAPVPLPVDRQAARDIRCKDSGQYQGNVISPVFSLTVSGPDRKLWVYQSSDDHSGTMRPPLVVRAEGTYELIDDLAVFTGTLTNSAEKTSTEIRFGVNFGFPGGKVAFNRFFPGPGDNLRYHRKWFVRQGKGWQPVREITLTIPRTALVEKADTWKVPVKGERVVWAGQDRGKTERIEEHIVYRKSRDRQTYVAVKRPSRRWLPSELRVQFIDGKAVAAVHEGRYIADLRGLHPRLAIPPE
jgi:hypothetical protein